MAPVGRQPGDELVAVDHDHPGRSSLRLFAALPAVLVIGPNGVSSAASRFGRDEARARTARRHDMLARMVEMHLLEVAPGPDGGPAQWLIERELDGMPVFFRTRPLASDDAA
jgi:hypothetical protein